MLTQKPKKSYAESLCQHVRFEVSKSRSNWFLYSYHTPDGHIRVGQNLWLLHCLPPRKLQFYRSENYKKIKNKQIICESDSTVALKFKKKRQETFAVLISSAHTSKIR